MPSLLIRRSTFFVLSSRACQKQTMKDRSSTPPLHVHVDENTPVHVHIKKLPKPAATGSQVGACPWGEVKAAEQVPSCRSGSCTASSEGVTDRRARCWVSGARLDGRQACRAEMAAVVRRGSRAALEMDATRATPPPAWGSDPGFVPFPQKSHKRGMKGDTVNVRRSVRVKTKVPWMPPGKSSTRHVGCKWEVGSLLFRLLFSACSGSV